MLTLRRRRVTRHTDWQVRTSGVTPGRLSRCLARRAASRRGLRSLMVGCCSVPKRTASTCSTSIALIWVHVHLGLYGSFTDATLPVLPPRGQVRMRLVGFTHWSDLRGPAACELLTGIEVDVVRARLGPDPLRRDADPDKAWARIFRSRAPLATLLMDQAVVSGIGNIYRAELLFRHRLDPLQRGFELREDQWSALWSDLVELMHDGVHRGRIDPVCAEHDPVAMGRAPRQDRHGGEVYVYRRAGAPCLVCATDVVTARHAGRNLYWCPRCQQRSTV